MSPYYRADTRICKIWRQLHKAGISGILPAHMEYIAAVQKVLKKHLLLVLVVALVLLISIGYALGYRPGPGLTVVRAGTVVLSKLPSGATVYADETKRALSKGGDTAIALVPGNHSIIIDTPGNYPWSDVVEVKAHAATRVMPIFVATHTPSSSFPSEERAKADAMAKSGILPTAQKPLSMENGCALVSVSENRIIASGTTTPECAPPAYLCLGGTCADTVIFAPIATLRSVLPYPGRQDALIIAYGDTLAVLELNPLTPQYFAPLYKGVAPVAASWDATTLVLSDDNHTVKLTF